MKLHSDNGLRALLEPTVNMLGCELVAIEHVMRGGGGGQLLRIYIDREEGVTVSDCERVSHQVSGVLDVEDVISGSYVLEVSSPGLDRPLGTARDFERFSGHNVRLRTDGPINGQRNFKGLLRGLRGSDVVLEMEGQEVALPLDRIEKARLIPDI
ncbi:MAG: ribosome maturation factor RimP [Gammaproteobacteria bacterium]|jgi:ribosome maturation factor RimP|nr:ribosome maturation factor RimP [Gammaproteobacteria bacterium]